MPVKLRHPLVKIEKHRGKEASSPCLLYLSFSFCCFLLISCSGCLYRYIYVGLLSGGHFTEEIFSTIFPTKKGIFPSAGNTDSFTGFGKDLDYSNIDGEKDLFLLW
jgi:hypothetical protein